MGRIQVTISGDGLEAAVRVAPGPATKLAELRDRIAEAGVVYGIEETALERLADRLEDPGAEVTIAVARGSPPVPGVDGYLRGDVLAEPLPGLTADDGSIDYRERRSLQPVSAGELVAEIVAPTAGTPGRDVRGGEIASKAGQPHSQSCGEGVRAEADKLVAARDGVMLATEKTIDVVPLYTHAGNVDYESGNLHAGGSLLIQGDICSGFCATADGDVAITGAVQGGGVTAGGSVHVDQGILGGDRTIHAGGDIACHHATAARLIARRLIEVRDQATQSRMHAPRVRAADGHGAVRGGELRARDSIEVRCAGSEAGGTTVLAVADLLEERAELARRTVETSRRSRAASRHPSGRGKKALRAAIRAADSESAEGLRLRARQNELLESARIRVTDTCHPGVVLQFGRFELRPNTTLGPSSFRFDSKQRTIVREDLT